MEPRTTCGPWFHFDPYPSSGLGQALKEAAAHLVKVLKVGGGACAYRPVRVDAIVMRKLVTFVLEGGEGARGEGRGRGGGEHRRRGIFGRVTPRIFPFSANCCRHLVQHVQKGDSPRLDVDYLQNDLGKYQCKLTVPGISAFVIGPPGKRKSLGLKRFVHWSVSWF